MLIVVSSEKVSERFQLWLRLILLLIRFWETWFRSLKNLSDLILRWKMLLYFLVLGNLKRGFQPWLVRQVWSLIGALNYRLILNWYLRPWNDWTKVFWNIFVLMFLDIRWSTKNLILRIIWAFILKTLLYPLNILNFWHELLNWTIFTKNLLESIMILVGEALRMKLSWNNTPSSLWDIARIQKRVSSIGQGLKNEDSWLPN